MRAEPDAAAELARRCGGLPLALRLAGARLAHRPRWRVADLVRRLRAQTLPELAVEERSVADAFALSYGQLPEPAHRMFRLLGLYPAATFDVLGAAALAGVPAEDAQATLDDLVDVHLVEEPERDVYRLHDLLREFAAQLAAELPGAERREALAAVLDLQTHAAAAVMPAFFRESSDRDLGHPAPLRPDLLAEIRDPAARFERERRHLGAFVDAAAASGHPEYAWWLPRAAWWCLYNHGVGHELTALFRQAMTIVEGNGDLTGQATVANYLASGYTRAADFGRALELLRLSVRLRDQTGRHDAKISPLGNIAGIHHMQARFAESLAAAREARRLSLITGETGRSWVPLFYLAIGCLRLGRYDEALHYHRLQLLTAIDHREESLVIAALLYLQRVRCRQGSVPVAVARRHLTFVLRRARQRGLLPVQADAHTELGRLLRAEGRFAEATAAHQEAVSIARRMGDPRHEAEYLNDFGETCRAAGDLGQARELHERVLTVVMTVPQGYEEARAAAGLGDCRAGSDPAAARRLWTTALESFRRMGVPEQYEVEKRLQECR